MSGRVIKTKGGDEIPAACESCFLQRCHEINDERKRERGRARERATPIKRVPSKRAYESIQSAGTESRLTPRISIYSYNPAEVPLSL